MKLPFKSINIPSTVWLAVGIIALIVGLVLVIAFLKRVFASHEKHYGIWSGLLAGFVLALVLEGFLLMNSKNAIANLLGTKNMPAPIQNAVNSIRHELLVILNIPPSCLNE